MKKTINFISSEDSNETCTMHTTSNDTEIMMGRETDEIVEGRIVKFLSERYQEGLEESRKGQILKN